MKKIKKILKNKKIIKYSLVVLAIATIVVIILVIKNHKSLITKQFEYWVPLSSIKEIDKDQGYYIIDSGTMGISFESGAGCEIVTFSKDNDDIYKNHYYYNPSLFLSKFKPKGGWISEITPSCSYKKNSDSIVMNIKTETKDFESIGTYKLIDKETMLVTWGNSNVSNQIYKKIKVSSYIEPFYYYEEHVPDTDVYLRTIKKINIDEIQSAILIENGLMYFSDDKLASYIKEKYNMDFDDSDFAYINRDKRITYAYLGEAGMYSVYDITSDGYLNLYVPVQRRSEKEIIKRLEKRYKKEYERKVKVKLKKTTYQTYSSFIRFDMTKDDVNFIDLTDRNIALKPEYE